MKKLLAAMLGVIALGVGSAVADDAKTYNVEMTGVTWNGCKKYVRGAFKKVDGVVCEDVNADIKILAGDKPGTQKIVLKSTKELTKEELVKAIGAKADRFVVQKVTAGWRGREASSVPG